MISYDRAADPSTQKSQAAQLLALRDMADQAEQLVETSTKSEAAAKSPTTRT